METNPDGVQASTRTLRIVEALKHLDGTGVSELANHLDLPKSTVYNHLQTLMNEEFIVRDGDVYRLGLRFLDFGAFVSDRVPLVRAADDELEKLAASTGELTNLMVEEHDLGVYVDQVEDEGAVNTSLHVGKRVTLHQTAAGKAILSHLPRERVHEIVDRRGLERMTDNTITDRDALLAELDETRERGYAIDDQEWHRGLRCIAAPIRDQSDEALGAVSVAGPMSRVTGERFDRELPDAVLSTANVIELNVEHADQLRRR